METLKYNDIEEDIRRNHHTRNLEKTAKIERVVYVERKKAKLRFC